jgi:hypothetical protein
MCPVKIGSPWTRWTSWEYATAWVKEAPEPGVVTWLTAVLASKPTLRHGRRSGVGEPQGS